MRIQQSIKWLRGKSHDIHGEISALAKTTEQPNARLNSSTKLCVDKHKDTTNENSIEGRV